ncbi:MAG: DUF6298 domain-containing protein [Chthoniobacteraceae bacterium]
MNTPSRPSTDDPTAPHSHFPDVGFDTVGYAEGRTPVPHVPAIWKVIPTGADDTSLLQAAIDNMAAQSRATRNFHGALLLLPGTFRVEGQIRIAASGIVIRGSRESRQPTRIIATGRNRRTLLEIGAKEDAILSEAVIVSADIVPAGSRVLLVSEVTDFAVGDRVVVQRPGTKEWIASLGMDADAGLFADERVHWLPGSRDLRWDRMITAIDPGRKTITLDAPITTALEQRYGGGTVAKVVGGNPIREIGIEDLILESEYDIANAKDEEHAWIGIALDRVEDAWVRCVTARHFVGSAVRVGHGARRVTVEECHSEAPVSETAGYRRQSFLVSGQQVLLQRCTAEAGMSDFAAGFCAGGPNVFRDCVAHAALGPSGTFESWASGVLFERVRIQGKGLRLARDDTRSQGAGWTSANSAVSHCDATEIVTQGPEGAGNIVIHGQDSFVWKNTVPAADESSNLSSIPMFTWPGEPAPEGASSFHSLEIINGRFAAAGQAVWGGQVNAAWWKGQFSPLAGQQAGVSITRFAPGRNGTCLTEDLPRLAERMEREGTPFYGGGPGLWYDRRRDDHSIAARPDGNVWAPFFEMPWARSGCGTAWDGLSKYDLTKFNPWYFDRTRAFAGLCARHGLVLYHNLYNTHNLLESHAHWVDFPWRPANCINETGLPEPPQLDANNHIHLAAEFYNINHPGRRELHRAYIRHSLDQLGGFSNVIFSLAFQFSGPLAFQEFFLDTIAGWERETQGHVKIALVTSKDITDAILAHPVRAGQITVVDMRYWQTQPDGILWAPRGDRNRAFREMTWEQFGSPYGDTPPPTTPLCVYRQVREYRDRFPDKAIVAWHGDAGAVPILMAGGAQALMRNPASGQSQGAELDQTRLDAFVRGHLAGILMQLLPRDGWLCDPDNHWCLADSVGKIVLIYSQGGNKIMLAQTLPHAHYRGIWHNLREGQTQPTQLQQSWNAGDSITKPDQEDWLLLLRAE